MTYVAFPDGSQCLNGGECAESNENSTIFRCICPFGIEGKHCEGGEATRTYGKGPVAEPVSGGGIAGMIIASLGIAVAIVFVFRMRQRRSHAQKLAIGDRLDALAMMGEYKDRVEYRGEEDDGETGIETTTIT